MKNTFDHEKMMAQFMGRRAARFATNMERLAQAMEPPSPFGRPPQPVQSIARQLVTPLIIAGQWLVDNSILLKVVIEAAAGKHRAARVEPASELIIEQSAQAVEKDFIIIELEPNPKNRPGPATGEGFKTEPMETEGQLQKEALDEKP